MIKFIKYKNNIEKSSKRKIQRTYKRVHKRIKKYEQKLEKIRGENGVGLIRFLTRNHKKEEQLEKKYEQKLKIHKIKIRILENIAETKGYQLPKYFIQYQFSLPMHPLLQKLYNLLYSETTS